MEIQNYVASLCDQYGSEDPFELCDALNITVLSVELPKGVDGFSLTIEGCQFIFLNEDLDERNRRMICAHELGHSLLHPQLNSHFLEEQTYLIKERYEREADEFCVHLLLQTLPDELKGRDSLTIEEIAEQTGLPPDLVRKKFDPS